MTTHRPKRLSRPRGRGLGRPGGCGQSDGHKVSQTRAKTLTSCLAMVDDCAGADLVQRGCGRGGSAHAAHSRHCEGADHRRYVDVRSSADPRTHRGRSGYQDQTPTEIRTAVATKQATPATTIAPVPSARLRGTPRERTPRGIATAAPKYAKMLKKYVRAPRQMSAFRGCDRTGHTLGTQA